MPLISDLSLADPRLLDFASLTDVELRTASEPAQGLFLAESPKVILRALHAGFHPRAVLLTAKWLESVEPLIRAHPDVPIFVGTSEQLEAVSGFHMHRGAIASFERPKPEPLLEIARNAKTVVVLEDLVDHANVGAVFRSAAALGADGVILSPSCADPLYRRAVRVSMGAVLQVPWMRSNDLTATLKELTEEGFETVALALDERASPLGEYLPVAPKRVALVLGSEGEGLTRRTVAAADKLVTIPMANGIDSLNVATCAALALWSLQQRVTSEQ